MSTKPILSEKDGVSRVFERRDLLERKKGGSVIGSERDTRRGKIYSREFKN